MALNKSRKQKLRTNLDTHKQPHLRLSKTQNTKLWPNTSNFTFFIQEPTI